MTHQQRPQFAPQLTYGIVPPKISSPEERRQEVAAIQAARIAALPVDALVVYDLQDESSRTSEERPFPFIQPIDPLTYSYEYLRDVPHPRIVYRSVSGQTPETLTAWLRKLGERGGATVFVGAPSDEQEVSMQLGEAYKLRRSVAPNVPLGGVTIAERHDLLGTEEERILRKVASGCSFFISQAVYSVTKSKNMLSDLHYHCEKTGDPPPRLLLTLSPCGSMQTLQFLHWLGISVPRWLRNELAHAHDILEKSVELSLRGFEELFEYAKDKGLSIGCNIESVSLRKAEIDASVEMVSQVAHIMDR